MKWLVPGHTGASGGLPLLGHPHEVAENHPGNVSPMEPARLWF